MAKPHLAGEANGKWMGEILCIACGEPAKYKTQRLCRKHYDRQRLTGVIIGPARSPGHIPVYDECVAQECHRSVKGLGMCVKHYTQYRRMVLHKPS